MSIPSLQGFSSSLCSSSKRIFLATGDNFLPKSIVAPALAENIKQKKKVYWKVSTIIITKQAKKYNNKAIAYSKSELTGSCIGKIFREEEL
jgi:hypothetical protein